MKKLLSLILVLLLFIPSTSALASNIDWQSMSDQEITDAINEARIELASRIPDSSDHMTIVNQDGIEVYLTRQYVVENPYADKFDLKLEAVAVNGTDQKVTISDNGSCINGWAVDTSGFYEVPAGRMQKGFITMRLNDANISTFEEINDIEFVLYAYSNETYATIANFEPFTFAK